MSEVTGLHGLVRHVRRRYVWNVLVAQIAQAASFAMGGLILLLIFGTEVLDWYWLALLFGGSLAILVYRTIQGIPSRYRIAQIIDRRLGLHDSLSTACYYSEVNPNRTAEPDVLRTQRRQAEDHAREVDVRIAAPLVMPKALYATSALALVAFGMLGVRYGIRHSLDLKPPLSQSLVEIFRAPAKLLAADKPKNEEKKKLDDFLRQNGISLDQQDASHPSDDKSPDSATASESSDRNQETSTADPNGKSKDKADGQQAGSEQQEGNEQSESAEGAEGDAGNDASSDSSQSGSPQGKQANQQQAGKQNNPSGDNSGLLDKMRDAMSNLLAKLKLQPKQGESQQASSKSGAQQSGSQQSKTGQKDSSQPGRQQNGAQNQNGQSDQEGEGSERAQSGQGKTGDKGGDKATQDAKSGIGRNDGSKDLRDAEQLAAMGKISEIIGKRSANLTGEVMVEVPSGRQQLRTPYMQKRANHVEAGGENNRDEVPLELQSYVQQYFEEIHKTAPSGAKSKSPR